MLALYVRVTNWLQSEEGQDLAEYALLLGLIALIVIAAVAILGQGLSNVFTNMGNEVKSWFTP